MAESTFTQPAADTAEMAFRCHLLMPVIEGNTLEDEDVSSFLAGRLTVDFEASEPLPRIQLS
ncbi:MAG: hypothetical protein ACLPJW_17660 [Rhodomicrobium sp.]